MTDEFGAPAGAARGGRNRGAKYVDSRGIERDRWDHPLLPHPVTGDVIPWTRPSTLGRVLDDEYNLTKWKLRMAVSGLSRREGLVARAALLTTDKTSPDYEQDRAELDRIADEALAASDSSRGADLGTAMHRAAEMVHGGASLDSLGLPESLRRDVGAYLREAERLKIEFIPWFSERMSCCTVLETAGTADDYVLCADGVYRVLDRKTGQDDHKYGQMSKAIQLASYANGANLWNVKDQVWEPMPEPIDTTVGIIAHVPAGKGQATFYPVDLTRGMKRAKEAVRVRAWRKDQATLLGPAMTPPAEPERTEGERAAEALEGLAVMRIRGSSSLQELMSVCTSLTPASLTENVMKEAMLRYSDLAG